MRKYLFMLLFVGTIFSPLYSAVPERLGQFPFVLFLYKTVKNTSKDAASLFIRGFSFSTRTLAQGGTNATVYLWNSLFNRFGFITRSALEEHVKGLRDTIGSVDNSISRNFGELKGQQELMKECFINIHNAAKSRIQDERITLYGQVDHLSDKAQTLQAISDKNIACAALLQHQSNDLEQSTRGLFKSAEQLKKDYIAVKAQCEWLKNQRITHVAQLGECKKELKRYKVDQEAMSVVLKEHNEDLQRIHAALSQRNLAQQ